MGLTFHGIFGRYNRRALAKPLQDETPEAKKQRLAIARKAARQKSFNDSG
jgi:hypothetical protein